MSRIICWFSCGAASAVATHILLKSNNPIKEGREIVIVRNHLAEEHSDNNRFAADCEKWFGQKIISLSNDKFHSSTKVVWEKVRFMKNQHGAPCTKYLKKEMRKNFQKPDDIHVFGFTNKEQHRVDNLLDGEPEINIFTPLIEQNVSKAQCLATLKQAKIELPEMYKLGYINNNCIGCVKGGMGYWNKIRKDFPEVFKERAEMERKLGYALLKSEAGATERKGKPIFLDELKPNIGRYKAEPSIECGIICESFNPQTAEE